MGVEIYFFLVFTFGQHCLGRIYLIGIAVLYPVAIGIAPRWVGRVLTGSRIEQHLRVVDVVIAEGGAEHAKLAHKPVIESFLCGIKLCHKIVVFAVLYYGVVVYYSERGTIV